MNTGILIFKLLLPVLCILQLSPDAYGQETHDYISYFNTCNEGDRYYYYKKYDSALMCFKSAFEKVPYVHTRYLEKAAICTSKLKDHDGARHYLIMALKQGNDSKYLATGKIKMYRKLPEYKLLKDSLLAYASVTENNHNKAYQNIIDSLLFIDQAIRTGEWKVTRKDDSLNFSCLLQQFKIYGYPSEKSVGQERYEKAFIIILHFVRAIGNEHYLDLIREYVRSGDCLPEDYAWIAEDSYLFRGLEPPYYFNNEKVLEMSEKEKQKINSERKKIGMKPIEAYTVFRIGRMVGTSEKW